MKIQEVSLHIRRCHMCGTVNETEEALVDKCQTCGKFFAPFVFFDEKAALGLNSKVQSDIASMMNNRLKSKDWHLQIKTQYPPLRGFTVYWEHESYT